MQAPELLASLVSESRANKAQETSAGTKAQERYRAVVRDLAAGKVARDQPEERVREVLALVGKSGEDLARDVAQLQKRQQLAALVRELPERQAELKAAQIAHRRALEEMFGVAAVHSFSVPEFRESPAMRAMRVRIAKAQSSVAEAGRARTELFANLRQEPTASAALDRQSAAELHVRKLTADLKQATALEREVAQSLPQLRERAKGDGLAVGLHGRTRNEELAQAERRHEGAREDATRLDGELAAARREEVAAAAAVAALLGPPEAK